MSTHFDPDGHARMVDVSAKIVTVREAVASSQIRMSDSTANMIREGNAKKGDVLGVARLAAIQATKLTQLLIPLCHAIPIEAVSVEFDWLEDASSPGPVFSTVLRCNVHARTTAKTGIEMEAMTAASVAALTVYDMVKSVDRGVEIGPIRLEQKSGGKSGDFRRSTD
ncbi:MAG: cyclic pyranopterin monophosphate synthase MoaC [Planctomycetota bacterium]